MSDARNCTPNTARPQQRADATIMRERDSSARFAANHLLVADIG